MSLEGLLRGLHALLRLEPDQAELVLNVVNHDLLTLTTADIILILTQSRRVRALQLERLLSLHVLAAVGLPENAIDLLDLVVIGEQLVSGDDVLVEHNQGQQLVFFLLLSSLVSSPAIAAHIPCK